MSLNLPGTFVAFSGFHLNTSNLQILKLSSFSRDPTLLLGDISNLKWKWCKTLINTCMHCSPVPRKPATWLAVYATPVAQTLYEPF
jgi:hypothetical protein